MKCKLFLVLLFCGFSAIVAAQAGSHQGTMVRMRLASCPAYERGFMMTVSGSAGARGKDLCPEYTLLTEKIVYILVGKVSTQLVPLAEVTKFRLQNRELLIRIDDANHETRFLSREMMLRSDWERQQQHEEEDLHAASRREQPMDFWSGNEQ